jgi:uncharacterized Tic20 family protein
MLAHLSALLGLAVPFGSVLAPLVVWLVKREQSAFVADQGKESLNFNITVAIGGVICIVLAFVFIGILLGIALFVYWLVMTIIAGIKTNEGVQYRYPFAIRLVK